MKRCIPRWLLCSGAVLGGCALTAPPMPSTPVNDVAVTDLAVDDVPLILDHGLELDRVAPPADESTSVDTLATEDGSTPRDTGVVADTPMLSDVSVAPDVSAASDVLAPPDTPAPPDVMSCGDTSSDVNNCGSCGTRCSFNNAVALCVAGRCTLGDCAADYRNCDGNATNGCEARITGSTTHCGRCNNACTAPVGATAVCRPDGTCGVSITCSGTMGDCDGNAANGCEVDTATSPQNCGMCGRSCAAPNTTPRCERGTCANTCNSGFGDCDGNGGTGCETRLDTLSHCGACGRTCSFANAVASCTTGTCVLGTCNAGFGDCDGNSTNGCETRLDSLAHCGACGRACSFSNATASCASGACALGACNTGFGNCDANNANGCETALSSNPSHCGACGRSCAFANASAACMGGSCLISTCNSGFGNCDGNAANGCETNLTTNTLHCGACGRGCGVSEVCMNGVCRSTCSLTLCGSACVDTSTDVSHCGACSRSCSLSNATARCTGGMCAIMSCAMGFGDCDGVTGNGCEVNLQSSTAHCGACGRACAPANATGACASGTCAIAACTTGFGDCDGAASNGCETSLTATATHCGGCGNVCPSPMNGSAFCRGGTCAFTCNSGYVASGTECVACGGIAQPPCSGGCNAGLTDCSGFCRDLDFDRNNCGVCGRRCSSGSYCEDGNCGRTCPRPPCPEP